MRYISLFLVLLFVTPCFGQYNNEYKFLKANTSNGTTVVSSAEIRDKTFAAATVDTCQPIDIVNCKTILLSLQSYDSCTILIKYRVSLDTIHQVSGRWSTLTTKDSLTQSADGSVFKSIDMTSTLLGAKSVQFTFDFDAQSGYMGATTPKYTATVLLRKY